jgi:hypothetical protein
MKDPRRFLISGIMLICFGLPIVYFCAKFARTQHTRFLVYKKGVATTSASISSASQGKVCTTHSCAPAYYVKYSFTPAPVLGQEFFYIGYNFRSGKTTYNREHDEERVKLPEQVWRKALQSGTLRVTYSPSNPWVNNPYTDQAPADDGGAWILLVFLGVVQFGAGIVLVCIYRNRRKNLTTQSSGRAARTADFGR